MQLSRICDITDPLVDVVYVSPFPVSDDLKQYYIKVLQVVDSERTLSPATRGAAATRAYSRAQ